MAQAFDVQPVDASFGAVVTGIRLPELDEADLEGPARHLAGIRPADLSRPVPEEGRADRLRQALRAARVRDGRGQQRARGRHARGWRPSGDDVVKILKGNEGWHADIRPSSRSRPRARCSAPRSCRRSAAIPAGPTCARPTMRSMRRPRRGSRTLAAYHSLHYSQAASAMCPKKGTDDYARLGFEGDEDVLRPLVKIHPDTGRKSLLIGRHAHDIPGLAPEESAAAAAGADRLRLPAAARLSPRLAVGDVVIWDNRCLLHQATPFDMTQPRVMWHTRIAGDPGRAKQPLPRLRQRSPAKASASASPASAAPSRRSTTSTSRSRAAAS